MIKILVNWQGVAGGGWRLIDCAIVRPQPTSLLIVNKKTTPVDKQDSQTILRNYEEKKKNTAMKLK